MIYEGIGPAKSQFIIKCLSDNKNRAAAEIRHLFSKYGGALGSVAWNFEQKGVIRITNDELNHPTSPLKGGAGVGEEFELELIDAGAEDILREEEGITIYTKMENLQKVKYIGEKTISRISEIINTKTLSEMTNIHKKIKTIKELTPIEKEFIST